MASASSAEPFRQTGVTAAHAMLAMTANQIGAMREAEPSATTAIKLASEAAEHPSITIWETVTVARRWRHFEEYLPGSHDMTSSHQELGDYRNRLVGRFRDLGRHVDRMDDLV